MGLIHSRARKKRDRAEARLLNEQSRQMEDQRRREQRVRFGEPAELPWWRQPTVGEAISAWRSQRRNGGDGRPV